MRRSGIRVAAAGAVMLAYVLLGRAQEPQNKLPTPPTPPTARPRRPPRPRPIRASG